MIMRYAVKLKDTWYIAKQVKASCFGSPNIGGMNLDADQLVWADEHTGGYLCSVGNETKFIGLDEEGSYER